MWRIIGLALLATGCNEYDLTHPDDNNDLPEDTDEPVVPEDTDEPVDTEEPPPEEEEDPVPGEPVAVAGPDRTIEPPICTGSALLCMGADRENLLDGSDSYDPAGLAITEYKWTLISKPPDSHALLMGARDAKPTQFFDVAGFYTFELTVKNSAGVWDSTPDRIVFEAIPSKDFYVQLTWDAGVDLDLHVLRDADANASGLYDNDFDISYCHQEDDWGTSGGADDPSLDWDAIEGYGPETTTIESPANDVYAVKVVYYGLHGFPDCRNEDGSGGTPVDCPDATAKVKIYFDGSELGSYTYELTESSQVWYVADISWPSRAITVKNSMSTTDRSSCY